MIEINAKGNAVNVIVTGQYPVHLWVWTFSQTFVQESQAQLLAHNLREHLTQKLEAIRKEAYLQGWKDAKAKNTKQTWFKGWW